MKVRAYVVVKKGYNVAIEASQWLNELREGCDEHNRELHGGEGDWQSQPRDRTVVTVEFELPDTVFDPPPAPPVIQGIIDDRNGAKSDSPDCGGSEDGFWKP